jgi:agmatine/peptidylarginine deiminase
MSQARLLARIRREFQDHPGIAMTLPQARRLWSLDERSAAEAFAALTAEGFLQRINDVYLWAAAPVPRFRPRTTSRPEARGVRPVV